MKTSITACCLVVCAALQAGDRLWAAEYDPCSRDNFRKTLLVSQEVGMLNQQIAHCYSKNPERARDSLMAHLEVTEEHTPEGVEVRSAVMSAGDGMDPHLDGVGDAVGFRSVKIMGDAYDGVVYDANNIMPGNGVVEVVGRRKVKNKNTGQWEWMNDTLRQNFDYEELYNPDGTRTKSVKVNAHLFFEDDKSLLDEVFETRVLFGRNNKKPVAVRAVTGKSCLTTRPSVNKSKDICTLQLESLPSTDKVTPTRALRLSKEQIEEMAKYRMPVTLAGHSPKAEGYLDGVPLSDLRFLQDTFLFFTDYARDYGVVMHAADTVKGSSGGGLMVTSENLKILFPEYFESLPAGSYKIATHRSGIPEGNIAIYTD